MQATQYIHKTRSPDENPGREQLLYKIIWLKGYDHDTDPRIRISKVK
jgi:hypothetical protein